MVKMYEIDDGAQHTVLANNEAEAFGIYAEHLILSGADWPDERPIIKERQAEESFTLILDDRKRLKLSVSVWRQLFHRPQYLGCSDF